MPAIIPNGSGFHAAVRSSRAAGARRAPAAALLFLGYLRVSWTVAATSDGAAQALQARDMLAGNWLLHGWTVSDVSFYTTELPEYVLVELARPFGAAVIHVAAAVTYTLLVLGAFALARGRARGTEGLVRGVLAAGIMLAPQLGYGAFVLLLSPDHVGTQVPLLLGWLLLDLAAAAPLVGARRLVPAARLGPVRGPGRARDSGPATGCRVRRSTCDTPDYGTVARADSGSLGAAWRSSPTIRPISRWYESATAGTRSCLAWRPWARPGWPGRGHGCSPPPGGSRRIRCRLRWPRCGCCGRTPG